MPKWALFAPVFVPLLMRLNVTPEAVLAAYRGGYDEMHVDGAVVATVFLHVGVFRPSLLRERAGLGAESTGSRIEGQVMQ